MHTFTLSDDLRTTLLARESGPPLASRSSRPLEASAANCSDLVRCTGNAFVHTLHLAFVHHLALVLSPDDVWLCLSQGFALHVHANAEQLRHLFVSHDGTIPLDVRRDEFIRGSPDNDWSSVLAEFASAIGDHLGGNRELLTASFSTTGNIERAVSHIVLMSAMQQYFEYSLTTLCGIPQITLLGTVHDWRAIRARAESFAAFGLEGWVSALLPVLDRFVDAAQDRVDAEFWRACYKLEDGSGGPYVSGWVNVLFPFLQIEPFARSRHDPMRSHRPNEFMDRWHDPAVNAIAAGPKDSDFPLGLSRAPFAWNYYLTVAEMEVVGGFVGVSQDPLTGAVRPAIGWAVREAAILPDLTRAFA